MFVSPANKNLRDTLVRLNLCSDRDFRRCRRIVRKLARGIPAFDFVWIDALVQSGSLTPYQAKVLQSAPPERLCIGRYVLLQRLGSGRGSETYRARGGAGDTVVLKRLRITSEELTNARAALGDCIDKARGLESPFVVSPHSFAEHDGAVILLSRYAAGTTCKELLVRRGRFRADVVAEIARQVAHGCAALEARGLLHGQIRLDNVRITNKGNAVLVDAGIGDALRESVRIRDDVPPDTYDAIAPERIGTGEPIRAPSEIYAFGCLLWQLLAGRPPFPTGDPLAKLAAHQSRSVPDVRTIAPDVPPPLADAVRACTCRDPTERPPTFAGIARRFGTPNPKGRQRLSRFLRRFDGAAPADQLTLEKPARFPTAAVALLVFVLSGAALFLLQHGATAELLRLGNGPAAKTLAEGNPGHTADPLPSAPLAQRATADAQFSKLAPLPSPSADGVIELGEGNYEAENVNFVGDLVIRGAGRNPTTIQVRDRPFRASCRKFALEHVIVRHDLVTPLGSLLEIHSQEVAISACAFRAEDRSAYGCVISWSAAPTRDPDAGRIHLIDTVFATERSALRCETAPTRVELEDCLKVRGGLLDLGNCRTDHEVIVFAQHLTLRQASWLCCLSNPSRTNGRQLRLVLQDSAFELKGSTASLIRLVSSANPSQCGRSILVTGRESMIGPNVPIVAWSRPGQAEARPFDSTGLVVEGLAVGDFQFVGPADADPAASSVDRRSLAIPRQSDEPPGIVPERLASAIGRSGSAR
ncbi:MAG TPA: serine/threonine-protein kinase [Planctomycetaceae bacterium]|nr:serine/threonine-protein kinase [Planctomycetaceae bacterium]